MSAPLSPVTSATWLPIPAPQPRPTPQWLTSPLFAWSRACPPSHLHPRQYLFPSHFPPPSPPIPPLLTLCSNSSSGLSHRAHDGSSPSLSQGAVVGQQLQPWPWAQATILHPPHSPHIPHDLPCTAPCTIQSPLCSLLQHLIIFPGSGSGLGPEMGPELQQPPGPSRILIQDRGFFPSPPPLLPTEWEKNLVLALNEYGELVIKIFF